MANEHMASDLHPPPLKSPHQSLAPLEYLQNQRRGSITDPALFLAQQHHPPPQDSRHPLADTFTHSRNGAYAFPPATNGHKLMETSGNSNTDQPERGWGSVDHAMDVADPNGGRHSSGSDAGKSGPPSFLPPSFTGSKRKMSHDRQGFHYPTDDPNNPGGYPNFDAEGPQAKRRSSTFDTNNRIAHLTLQDRRDSVDSRSSVGGASLGGWAGDRRDSATSMYSATSLGSSVGGYAGWSGHGGQQQQQADSNNPDMHTNSRNFAFPQDPVASQPFALPPAPIIPSVRYSASAAVARRLSIPESSLPSNGLKQRVRRGSRNPTTAPAEGVASPEAAPSVTVSGSPDSMGTVPASDAQSNMTVEEQQQPQQQQSGATSTTGSPRKDTPYSRSPELRVSHKMAERKRRKEMKDLFDELRDQLPADRGMKASKWEILSKAVDYIAQLKLAYTEMSAEIENLRGEVEARIRRHDIPPPPPPVQDLATAPGTPVSAMSPDSNGPANGHATPNIYGIDRPPSSQSPARQTSMALTDQGRSPSVSTRSLQQQLTGGNGRGHHQTPTPQLQPNPLPVHHTGS